MSTYKIKVVTDNADWFSLTLEDGASWVLPLTLDGKQGPKVSIAFISLSTQELMAEGIPTDGGLTFPLELNVQTDKASLPLVVDCEGTVTVNSDVDHQSVTSTRSDISLRLT